MKASFTAHARALREQRDLTARLHTRLATRDLRDFKTVQEAYADARAKLAAMEAAPVPAKRVTRRNWLG